MWDYFHIFCFMCRPCLSEQTQNRGRETIDWRYRIPCGVHGSKGIVFLKYTTHKLNVTGVFRVTTKTTSIKITRFGLVFDQRQHFSKWKVCRFRFQHTSTLIRHSCFIFTMFSYVFTNLWQNPCFVLLRKGYSRHDESFNLEFDKVCPPQRYPNMPLSAEV